MSWSLATSWTDSHFASAASNNTAMDFAMSPAQDLSNKPPFAFTDSATAFIESIAKSPPEAMRFNSTNVTLLKLSVWKVRSRSPHRCIIES